ncbi:hypothetical protein CSUI_000121 [Cystoisospora suis]|uniref:Uncharacterized protein n=1 Tax=Cystoisospora suis TaxID=483139 RepID=A0A2C6LIL9_9APIC|nr:hypothetical protein CSUI_000121 [Cystoisospora suis]
MFQGDRTQVEARSSHNAGQSVTGRGDLSQRASVSQPLEPGEPEEPPVSPWFEELFQLSWPGTEGEGASGETSERSIETNQVHLIDEYRDPGLMPSFPAQQTSAVVQPEAVSEGDEGFPRKKSKASKGTYEGSLINESRSSTPTLSPSDSEGSAVVQPVSLTEDSADEGPPRKKSKFWTGVDNDGQATEPASSSDASTTPSPVSPIETSTGLQPVPVSGADSPVGVAAESSAAHAQAAGAWPGAEQAELLTSPRAGRQWGPQGPSLDSHAPASQDTPQLVHHHSSSSTSPRLAPEHQRADVGQDVAVADRTLAPYGESMTSLRALGLTESHCSTESLARQGQILIEMMKAADLHLPDFAGAASAYAGVGLEQLRSLRSDLAGQLERAYSAAAAATHEWGESCRRVHHKWKRFKARLRQLTAVTLFMTGQLGNTQQP